MLTHHSPSPVTTNLIVSDDEEEESRGEERWLFPDDADNVVLHQSGGDEEPYTPRGTTGVLILDGESSSDEDLSYPDSIPTEIMTSILQDGRGSRGTMKRVLLGSLVAGLTLLIVILLWDRADLVKEHQGIVNHNLVLEEELQQTKETMSKLQQEQSSSKKLVRRIDGWNTNKIRLVDNCWFKAELELGECMKDVKESLDDWTTDATRNLKQYLHGGRRTSGDDDGALQEASAWRSFTDATMTVSIAASNVMDSMVMFGKKLDDTVLYAVEQSRDAIQEATQYMREDL